MEALRHDNIPKALPRSFFARPVDEVARELLGCFLVRKRRGIVVGGRIVETEAYGGPGDRASHADRAPTGRAKIMFGPPGIVYVYFTYGMHHCMNIVTGPPGQASAVLLRAVEPLWGTDRMRDEGAPARLADHLLASGPGRICRALGIDRRLNGADLSDGPIGIHRRREAPGEISAGARVGLTHDDGRLWRFWVPSRAVTRRGPGSRSRGR